MKLNRWIYSIASAAFLLSACTAEQPDGATGRRGVLQLKEVAVSGETRALVQTDALATVSLYVTREGVPYTLDKNANPLVQFTKSDGKWTPGTAFSIYGGQPATVYACYPTATVVTSPKGNGFTVPATVIAEDDFAATSQTDYLHGTSEATAESPTVALTLKHALAKVSFCVKKVEGATETIRLTQLEILSAGNNLWRGTGVMNLTDGSLDGLTSSASMVLKNEEGIELKEETTDANLYCLTAPMKKEERQLSFRLTVAIQEEGQTESTTYTFLTGAVKGNVQWLSHRHYLYTIKVNKVGGTLTGIQINGWMDDASQDTHIGI